MRKLLALFGLAYESDLIAASVRADAYQELAKAVVDESEAAGSIIVGGDFVRILNVALNRKIIILPGAKYTVLEGLVMIK